MHDVYGLGNVNGNEDRYSNSVLQLADIQIFFFVYLNLEVLKTIPLTKNLVAIEPRKIMGLRRIQDWHAKNW